MRGEPASSQRRVPDLRGRFRYVPNAIHTVGFLSLWSPGVALASYAAIVLAAFNHAYIWVHYFCTERPDIRRIYG